MTTGGPPPVAFLLLVLSGFAAAPARAEEPPDSARAETNLSGAQRLVEHSSLVPSRGHARAVPGSAHFLGPDVLRFQNASFADVHRLMVRVPGVYAVGEDGYGLRPNVGMRGVDPYRSADLAIMEDGVLASPAPYAAPGLPVFAGLARMESIETMKGAGATVSGPGATGGAVNFVTAGPPDDLVGSARLSLGSDDARSIHIGYGDSWRGASWRLVASRTRTDGFKALDGGGETGFEHDDYLVRLRLRSAPDSDRHQEVQLKLGYFETDARDSYLGLTDADFEATRYRRYAASQRDRIQHEATQVMLRHFIAVSDALDVTTSVYRNDVDLDWYLVERVNGEQLWLVLADPASHAAEYAILTGDSSSAADALVVKANARSYFSQGVQTVLGAAGTTGKLHHELAVGVRYHEDEEDRLHRIDGYRMTSGGAMVLTSRGADGGAGGGDNEINEARSVVVFARDRISGGRWSVTPGARVEHVRTRWTSYAAGDSARTAPFGGENSATAVVPGVSVLHRAARGVSLFGGVHAAWAPPAPGNSGDGLRTLHYEAGGRAARDGMDAALVGFLTRHGLAGAGATERAWGLEASAGYEIRDSVYGIDLSVAYTFTRAEFRGDYTFLDNAGFSFSGDTGDAVPYVPEHAVAASIALTTPRSYAGAFASYAGRVRTEPGSGDFPARTGAGERLLLDFVTEYELIRRVRVFASVANVLDEVYVASRFPHGAHPGAPRTFTAGLKLEL